MYCACGLGGMFWLAASIPVEALVPDMRQNCLFCGARVDNEVRTAIMMHPILKIPCVRCKECGEIMSLFA